MKASTIIITSLSAVAIGALAANAVQYFAYNKLTADAMIQEKAPIEISGAVSLASQLYANPSQWLWKPEVRGIARQRANMAPRPDDQVGIKVSELIAISSTEQRLSEALSWYGRIRQRLAESDFPEFAQGGLYCDENTAIFRNLIERAGIKTRVVNFQWSDGDGGASHTALRLGCQKHKWSYVDPHYGAYDGQSVLEILISHKDPTGYTDKDTEALKDVFQNGAAEIVYESFAPRQRIHYKNLHE